MNRPQPGQVEERTAPTEVPIVDGRRLRGVIPYGVESRDLGGFREVIDAGALDGANLEDLIATREHDRGKLLGRHPTTLSTEDRADGFAWSVELPDSPVGQDVRVAVERGDLRSTSWRMVVGRDRWDGDVRHVEAIAELLDVTVTAAPAYGSALAELRSQPETPVEAEEGNPMPETASEAQETAAGGLQVEDRSISAETRTTHGLAEAFRDGGFPGRTASVEFGEFRSATFTGSIDTLSPVRRAGVDLGADLRYAWPVFPSVSVDAGDTSVQVLMQTARTLPAAADVIRAIDAVTAKPEVASVLAIVTTALKQIAAIESNVPNVLLEQPAFNSAIEVDLKLALNEALDKLVLDAIAASGVQVPGTNPLLVSIRKAMTTLLAAGYNPDTVILTPANAEALDTLRATATVGEEFYVFSPAELAPRRLYGLQTRVSKTAAAPVVVDSRALGKLYTGPVSLARFEVDAGSTNRSNIRMELNAVFGVERQNAAVRIAAT